jgi:sugar phosphate isomerase/epimerase
MASQSREAAESRASMRFVPLGEEVIGYKGILGSLREDGFSGVVSLEPEFVDEKGGRPEACRQSYRGIRAIPEAGQTR